MGDLPLKFVFEYRETSAHVHTHCYSFDHAGIKRFHGFGLTFTHPQWNDFRSHLSPTISIVRASDPATSPCEDKSQIATDTVHI